MLKRVERHRGKDERQYFYEDRFMPKIDACVSFTLCHWRLNIIKYETTF